MSRIMGQQCVLCLRFSQFSSSDKVGMNDCEKKIHMELHRRHLELVSNRILTENELVQICFQNQKQRYSLYSRELLDRCANFLKLQLPQSGAIKCNVCGNKQQLIRINGRGGRQMGTSIAIFHACRHLGKLRFTCNHCQRRLAYRSTMQRHLRKAHRLYDSSDFTESPLDVDDEEIFNIFKHCFGSISEIYPEALSTQFKSVSLGKNEILRKLCLPLLQKHAKDKLVHCAKCNRHLKLFCNTTGWQYRKALDHVSVHSAIEMFSCKQCDAKYCTRNGVTRHLSTVHSVNSQMSNYVDTSYLYVKELSDVVKLCYGSESESTTKTKPGKRAHSIQHINKISDYCRKIFSDRMKEQYSICLLCNQRLKCIHTNRGSLITMVQICRISNHACRHLNKPIFECNHCHEKFPSKNITFQHLRHKHQAGNSKENFSDFTTQYEDDIIDTIKRCFGEPAPDSVIINKKCGTLIRKNELSDFCRLFFSTKKITKQTKCSKCDIMIKVRRYNRPTVDKLDTSAVIGHACVHLQKKLFTCKLCNEQFLTQTKVRDHLRHWHDRSSTKGNFIDLTQNYANDIKQIITECFKEKD